VRNTTKVITAVGIVGLITGIVHATPSTTYWTPATTDIQPYRTVHVGIDNYFTVFRKGADKGAYPTDMGLTVGVLPFEKVQAEVGVDLLEPTDDPWYANAKIGTPEGAIFDGSPALNLGIFNVGTKTNVTNQDIVFVMAGKTLPVVGRLFAGYYVGNEKVLVNGDGEEDNKGLMVGFDHGFLPVKDKAGDEYNRVVVAGDWASGKNAIGGGGAGVYYYFTKNIALLTGPVFFNDKAVNGEWKWTAQLDINIPF
jgi:hypothetical protein